MSAGDIDTGIAQARDLVAQSSRADTEDFRRLVAVAVTLLEGVENQAAFDRAQVRSQLILVRFRIRVDVFDRFGGWRCAGKLQVARPNLLSAAQDRRALHDIL